MGVNFVIEPCDLYVNLPIQLRNLLIQPCALRIDLFIQPCALQIDFFLQPFDFTLKDFYLGLSFPKFRDNEFLESLFDVNGSHDRLLPHFSKRLPLSKRQNPG